MQFTSPGAPAPNRGGQRVALMVVLAIHIVLLAVALMSRWVAPVAPPRERSTDVVVYLPSMQKPVEPPPPIPAPAELPPPPLAPPIAPVAPELPKLEFKPDAIVAPPSVPAPLPPAVVAAPAEDAKAAKAIPVPGAGTGTGAEAPKTFAECADTPERHMVADVYRLPRDTQSVRAMNRLKPIKRVCLAQLDVAPRNFTEGFPGLDVAEWFGLDIRFTITIAQAGKWDFVTVSDDGSRLSIDDREVIENDGIHGPHAVMATVSLAQGVHNIRLRYYQGPGPELAMMLAWKKEGAKDYVKIPQSIIGRPPADQLPPLP